MKEHGDVDLIIDLHNGEFKSTLTFYSYRKEVELEVEYEMIGVGEDLGTAIENMLNDIPRYYNRD